MNLYIQQVIGGKIDVTHYDMIYIVYCICGNDMVELLMTHERLQLIRCTTVITGGIYQKNFYYT